MTEVNDLPLDLRTISTDKPSSAIKHDFHDMKCHFTSPLRALLVALTTLLLSHSPLFAQDPTYEGRTISTVQVRYNGTKTASEERIKALVSSKAGQKYRIERLDEDLRTLYASGLIDDAIFLADPAGSNQVKIIIEVTTRPLLAGVGFEGEYGEKERDLREVTELKKGQVLSDQAILDAVTKIEKHFTELGYPDVLAFHRLVPTSRAGYSDLIIEVSAGERNVVNKIRFEGNNNITAPDLRREMKTKKKSWLSFITKSGRLDSYQLDEDFEALQTYYRNKGFLNAKVVGHERIPVKGDKIDLVIRIEEGNKFTVNQVGFAKSKVFTSEELRPGLTLLGGDPFSGEKLNNDIKTIRSYYGSRGYADARVTPDIKELAGNKINITYKVDPGRPYKVGRVTIEGNTKTQDRVIRRELPLKPGDNLNTVDLEVGKRRLENMRYFDRVDVSQDESGQPGFRDIAISLDERNTGSLSFGAGFSSIDAVVGYIRLEQTNFDLFNPWSFTGAGQRFAMNLQVGSQRQDFLISLTEPWFLGRRLALGGELYYRNALFFSQIFDQTNIGGAVFLRKPLGKRAFLRAEIRAENVEVEAEDSANAAAVGEGDFFRTALGLRYVYDSRDDNILPRKGHRFDAGITYVGEVLGADFDAITIEVGGQKHWSLPYDTILTLEGQVAVVDGDDLPIFERRFLGGQRDLRGFDFRDVGGPRLDNEGLGGATSAYITAEYTFPLFDEIRGAVFYDAGIVNVESFDFSTSNYVSDAGFGLRMNLPFGPIAVDYAIPLEKGNTEADGGRFQFYVNTQF